MAPNFCPAHFLVPAFRRIDIVAWFCCLLGTFFLFPKPGGAAELPPEGLGEDLVLTLRTTNEGTVGAPMPTLLTRMSIKAKMARIDLSTEVNPGPVQFLNQSTINFGDTGEALAIFHQNKTYQRFTREMQEASRQNAVQLMQQQGGLPTERPRLTATGRTKEINGKAATEYRSSNAQQELLYWVIDTEEFRAINRIVAEALANPVSSVLNMRFPDPEEFEGFAVRMEIRMEVPGGHKVSTIVTLEGYEWTTLSPDLFSIPEDYTEVQAQVTTSASSRER